MIINNIIKSQDDTTSAVRAYVTNENGYVAMCIEGCRVDPEILNGYAGIKDVSKEIIFPYRFETD